MALASALLLLLSACTSVQFEAALGSINRDQAAFTQSQLALERNAAQQQARRSSAQALLAQPLGQAQAVQLALLNSPALQAMLAHNGADVASATALGRLQLAGAVVDQVTQLRQAWVKAVAAQQTLVYAQQVLEAAQASAELAQRMQVAGNFSKLERARQQLFYAEASTQLAQVQSERNASRETLVRLLGLSDAQAAQLLLPERLPELPEVADLVHTPTEVGLGATPQRLDLQLAQAQVQTQAQTSSLAVANQLEASVRNAGSQLRESYGAYRSAYAIARNYHDAVLPLRSLIAEENLLRYNGMFMGVFELLAETREQSNAVMAAIAAYKQFWLADAALQSNLVGRPLDAAMDSPYSNDSNTTGKP